MLPDGTVQSNPINRAHLRRDFMREQRTVSAIDRQYAESTGADKRKALHGWSLAKYEVGMHVTS